MHWSRALTMFSLVCVVAVLVILGIEFSSSSMMTLKVVDLAIEALAGKREVVQKSDCAGIVQVRAFKITYLGFPGWYESHFVLEDEPAHRREKHFHQAARSALV